MANIRSRRITEAREVLSTFGLPAEQRNQRAALTLLALLDLYPNRSWAAASSPLRGVTPIMEFVAKHYGKRWERWKQRAAQLKQEVHAVALACRDPRVLWYARLLAICIVAYALARSI